MILQNTKLLLVVWLYMDAMDMLRLPVLSRPLHKAGRGEGWA